MKKEIALVVIIFFTLLIGACKKQREVIVSGKIVYKDTKQPVSLTQFTICVEEKSGIVANTKTREKPYTFTTDNNGVFKVVCEGKDKQALSIGYECNGYYYWYGSISKKNLSIDAGVIEADRK